MIELPPLTASKLWVHEDPMTGEMRESVASYTKYSVEARERILQARIAELEASLRLEKDCHALAYRNGTALGERVHELEADAERYRWLRIRNEGAVFAEVDPSGPYVVNDDPGADVYPTGAQLDAAIDAARGAK